jgi:DNA helicase II / ATP-dependent DNA helicase PcrA
VSPLPNLKGISAAQSPTHSGDWRARIVKPDFQPSEQQAQVFEWVTQGRGNAIIKAAAGAGKTTTIVKACELVSGDGKFLAFNKKISEEIGHRLQAAGVPHNMQASTFHSAGFQAWKRSAARVVVDFDKMEKLCGDLRTPFNLQSFVKQLVSIAKQSAVGVEDDAEIDADYVWDDLIDHHDLDEKLYSDFGEDIESLREKGIYRAKELMRASIESDSRFINFDDMLYAPLKHGAQFWKHDWIFIDEAQDTNYARRMLAAAMLKDNGRLVAIGDPHQAIYGFTGADADALDLIADRFHCIDLPLTVSYRCPQAVVEYAQKWVKHIQAAPSAPRGSVRHIPDTDFRKLTPESSDVILCRNVKPLISLALGYLKKRVPAHVEGGDIGQSLLSLVKRWKSARTVQDLGAALEDYRIEEQNRLLDKNLFQKLQQLEDKIDSIQVIMDTLHLDDSVQEVVRTIEGLFKDSEGKRVESITLSTIHKAKGREWNRVYLYGRNKFMPSPFAKQEWQMGQEKNLIYVAVTRAKQELVEVVLP